MNMLLMNPHRYHLTLSKTTKSIDWISAFSPFPTMFSTLSERIHHFSNNEFVVCKYFKFGQGQDFVVCKELKQWLMWYTMNAH